MNPEILRYIRANRGTYTREAITRQLIEAGHYPAEIERAWESIEPRSAGGLPRDRTFWRYFTLGVVALYGLTFLVYALRYLGFGDMVMLPYLIVLGVFLLLGAWTSLRLVRASRAVVKGATSGMLIAVLIPFVPLVIITGLCNQMFGSPL